MKITAAKVLLIAVLSFVAGAKAASVDSVYTHLGGNQWSVALSFTNDSVAMVSEFTVFFDGALFSNLSLAAAPGSWDSLLVQPDPGLPAAGFLDGLVLDPADALVDGSSVGGFAVNFEFLGATVPGELPFEFRDGQFNLLASGFSSVSLPPPSVVSLPTTVWLLLIALGAMSLRRRHLSRQSPASAAVKLMIAWFVGVGGANAWAVPLVEGIDLVSSTRFDRTKFDYTYRLRIQGDATGYTDAAVSVASSAAGTVVLKSLVQVGAVDADAFIRTVDTFVIRQDRTLPFDLQSLQFNVSGKRTEPDLNSGMQFGPTTLLQAAGRALHEGTFPLQSDSPVAGENLILRVTVSGPAEQVGYQFRNSSGAVLSGGTMNRLDPRFPWFAAGVTVPAEPFRMVFTARSDSGTELVWSPVRPFTPALYSVAIEPVRALLQSGEMLAGSVSIRSTQASGPHSVSLLLPTGFTAATTGWSVNLSPGTTVKLPFSATAPAGAAPYQSFTVGARVVGAGVSGPISEANLRVVVE